MSNSFLFYFRNFRFSVKEIYYVKNIFGTPVGKIEKYCQDEKEKGHTNAKERNGHCNNRSNHREPDVHIGMLVLGFGERHIFDCGRFDGILPHAEKRNPNEYDV